MKIKQILNIMDILIVLTEDNRLFQLVPVTYPSDEKFWKEISLPRT